MRRRDLLCREAQEIAILGYDLILLGVLLSLHRAVLVVLALLAVGMAHGFLQNRAPPDLLGLQLPLRRRRQLRWLHHVGLGQFDVFLLAIFHVDAHGDLRLLFVQLVSALVVEDSANTLIAYLELLRCRALRFLICARLPLLHFYIDCTFQNFGVFEFPRFVQSHVR